MILVTISFEGLPVFLLQCEWALRALNYEGIASKHVFCGQGLHSIALRLVCSKQGRNRQLLVLVEIEF